MTISNKLGASYESIRAAARIKTIKVAINDMECELKVRVPVKREMDEITTKLNTPDTDLVEKLYQDMAGPLKESVASVEEDFLAALNADGEKMRFTDNDVVVNGTSVRHIATLTALWQRQVELFFGLLQTETGEPVTETFEEIADEFPEAVIRDIIKSIDEAIRPSYQDAKKKLRTSMRRQVKAALIFNGHTVESVDEIDEETFTDICVMYGDGVLGGKAIYDAIAPLTTAVFNYIRQPSSPPFKVDDLFPWVNDYDKNPDTEPTKQDKTNHALLMFMTNAPEFNIERFKNGG